jgi:hypothetical protein
MQPPLDGIWGLPAEKLAELPGYDPDVAKNRAEARDDAVVEQVGGGGGHPAWRTPPSSRCR